jgi:hypothetical protein
MNKVVVVCNKEHEKGYEDYAGVCLLCEVEYHKNRAARWRAEAYKLIGHEIELPPPIGLTLQEVSNIWDSMGTWNSTSAQHFYNAIWKAIKEKNT